MRVLFLDIESSWNHDNKNPICWMSTCQINDGGKLRLFRTPEEVCKWYLKLKGEVITYIHKASFDLSYLIPYFRKYFKGEEEELKVDAHDYYFWRKGRYKFKDSWKLANCSLEKWGEMYNIEHKKQVGTFDYDKVIYQDTELTDEEKNYCFFDVLALAECMEQELKFHNTDYEHVPLTSTGYIRNELRNRCKNEQYRREYFLKLSPLVYRTALMSYCGGYTHLNRYYANLLVEGLIYYRDFQSHYPTMLRQRLYPLGKPRRITPPNFETILEQCKSGTFSVLFRVKFNGVKLKNGGIKSNITMPLLQVSKMHGESGNELIADNGRILSTDYTFIYSLNNIQLKLIYEQYDFGEYEILMAWLIRNKPLPKEIANYIDEVFSEKIRRGLVKDESDLNRLLYSLIKKALNGIYGLISTNPLKHKYLDLEKARNCSDEEFVKYFLDFTEKELNKFYSSRKNFLPYLIGVFCTSYATEELFKYIKAIGYDKVLYCDTDSIIYLSDKETENKIAKLIKAGKSAYVKIDGKKVYYYDFKLEHVCTQFKGEHAKCYGLVYNDELHLTIAGVPEKTYYNGRLVTREEELGELNNLTDEYAFTINTGTCAKYISLGEPQIINLNGHEIHTAGGCIIEKLKVKQISKITEE